MNSEPPRNSNLTLCYTLIALGGLCMLGTILPAFWLKNGIIERVSDAPHIDGLSEGFRVVSIDRQIQSKDSDIELEKKMPDMDKSFEDARKKLGLKTNSNSAESNFEDKKAARIKKLEDEKQALIAKKNELIGENQAKRMKPRTWDEFFEDYSLEILLSGVVPLGLFSLFLARPVLGRLPARNPLSLTDFERRSVIFLCFSLVFSAFGFFLFVWILDLIY